MKRLNIFIILICILSACKTSQHVSRDSSSPEHPYLLLPGGPAWGALYTQHAGEYRALCFQAYQLAKMRLDVLLTRQTFRPIAIVTDIDETILDNSPYSAGRALEGKEYSDESWKVWTDKASADTVPGGASFFKYAASRGVTIYYISNRKTNEATATLKNLKSFGFPFADNEHLLLKSTTSSKADRRNGVSKKFEIVMLLGDNLADFADVFEGHKSTAERNAVVDSLRVQFGDKFIMLPNAMYGDWQNALINYQYGAGMGQRDSLLRARLVR